MSLEIHQVQDADFAALKKYNVLDVGGDLVAPIVQVTWLASDRISYDRRNEWSINQQYEIFKNDPTATYLKVIDTSLPEEKNIVSFARWHFYKNGYSHPDMTPPELNGTAPDADQKWPEGIDVAYHKGFAEPLFAARHEWAGTGPQWFLTTLTTRNPYRRRGAGGMLVKWGVDRAKKDGVPAFLESMPDAASLYKEQGFKQVGTFDVPTPSGEVLHTYRMAANFD